VSNSLSGYTYWCRRKTIQNHIIRNGQQVQRILDTPSYNRELLPIKDEDKLLLYVGRFNTTANDVKNFQTCIDAMSLLSSNLPQLKLLVCGDGSERSKWEKKVTEAGLRNKIIFLGYLKREDVWGIMKIADALISISFFEGCPNVVQEAMICKCPIIVSDIQGHREILTETEAILVDPYSATGVSNAVKTLIAEKNKSGSRVASAALKAKQWTIESMLDQYEKLYCELNTTTYSTSKTNAKQA